MEGRPEGHGQLLAYKPADKSWGAVRYPLDKPETGWIGLSEITATADGLILVERDNQVGGSARVKLTYVSLAGIAPARSAAICRSSRSATSAT
ncbi:MAG: esterase-like activity of phytase family protein [Gammaproteobacteria bacterium]|nr:esterase-like activity of phytase family protein [Gammaproteobacteria bacterium]